MPSIVLKRRSFEMPLLCCVCGAETKSLLTHRQEGLPLVLPSVIPGHVDVSVEARDVTVPYCEAHAKALVRRGRWYQIVQAVAFLGGMALIVTGPADVLDTRVVGGIGVAAAIIMLLLKARILYDARVRRTRDGLVLSAPSAEFIEAVRRATDAPHAGKEQVTKPEDIPHSLERKIKLLRVRKRMGRQR